MDNVPLYRCNTFCLTLNLLFSATISLKKNFFLHYTLSSLMAQLLYLLVLSHRFLSLWPLENIVIYLSVSFIQQTIFEYLLSVRLLIVMQLFPVFFFSIVKMLLVVKILVQVSLGTCVRLSLWQLPIHRIAKV